MVLSLGETHAIFLLVTILVGEDNHEILTGVVFLEFIGQTLDGILVGDGAFTGRDDHEEMVISNAGSQLRQFLPMAHLGVFGPDTGVAVVDVFGNEY